MRMKKKCAILHAGFCGYAGVHLTILRNLRFVRGRKNVYSSCLSTQLLITRLHISCPQSPSSGNFASHRRSSGLFRQLALAGGQIRVEDLGRLCRSFDQHPY